MNAQDTVNAIIDHLLGNDWYIVDPVCTEQANEIILEEIQKKYKSRTPSKVDLYRMRHKRCKWCAHFDAMYYKCAAKDKVIGSKDWPRPLCFVFNLKKTQCRW